MMLADVNVLVNAFRRDTRDHAVCRHWLDTVTSDAAAFGVSPQVLGSVIRAATHPKIYATPSATAEAVAFCESLLGHPKAQVIAPADQHWSIFAGLCQGAGVRGNLVPDAWFAALSIEHGCEWVTLDRDFARFPGLRWRTPG